MSPTAGNTYNDTMLHNAVSGLKGTLNQYYNMDFICREHRVICKITTFITILLDKMVANGEIERISDVTISIIGHAQIYANYIY